MDDNKAYRERLQNLLNNVHSVRIQTSQDNSCIFIERIEEESGSDTESKSRYDTLLSEHFYKVFS